MKILLLACSYITAHARAELERARCTIHKEVPGIQAVDAENLEVVVLHYADDEDIHTMSVWGVPREIVIKSLCLNLAYHYEEMAHGYALSHLYSDESVAEIIRKENEPTPSNDLGELSDHPF